MPNRACSMVPSSRKGVLRVLFVQVSLFGSDASKMIIHGGMYVVSPPVIKERPKPLVEVVAQTPAAV